MEPSREPMAETKKKPWLFQPGNRANPFGQSARKVRAAQEAAELAERVKAEARALMSDFSAQHGRAPTASEVARIGAAALLAVKLREPALLNAEDIVRLSNSLERALRCAGLAVGAPPAPAPVDLSGVFADPLGLRAAK